MEPETSSKSNVVIIISLLFFICFFFFLFFSLPKYFEHFDLIDTNVLPKSGVQTQTQETQQSQEVQQPLAAPEHIDLRAPAPLQKAPTDAAFEKITSGILYDACTNVANISYNQAWIGMCANSKQLPDTCIDGFKKLAAATGEINMEVQQKFIMSCACPLSTTDSERVRVMHEQEMKSCAQYLTKKAVSAPTEKNLK